MKNDNGNRPKRWQTFAVLAAGIVLGSASRADLVELVNGDRYSGTVVSMTMTNLALRSGVQGLITLPREKLARITFGDLAPKSSSNVLTSSSSNVPADGLVSLAQRLLSGAGSADTNQTERVAEQLLENAGPEATQTYKQMVRGLLSGSLTVAELQKQAKQTIAEVEEAKTELGPDAGDLLDGYLSILRRFVQEPEPKQKSP